MAGFLALGVALLVLPDLAAATRPALGPARLLGAIFAGGAIALALQLVRTTRKGYVYFGRTEWIARADDLLMYRVWCLIHLLAIAGCAVTSITFLR